MVSGNGKEEEKNKLCGASEAYGTRQQFWAKKGHLRSEHSYMKKPQTSTKAPFHAHKLHASSHALAEAALVCTPGALGNKQVRCCSSS